MRVAAKRVEASGSEPAAVPRWQQVLGIPAAVARGRVWPLAVAVAIPVTLYAYVNYSKFKSLFGLPLEKQDIIYASDLGQRAFAAGGGKITGLSYLPTNLLQYFRPDAIGFDRLFPWVTFSGEPRVIGDAFFIDIDYSASITASSTLVLALALIGFVAIIRAPAPADGGPSAALLRIPVVVASAGAVITLSISYLQHRYEADFLPMFVLAGAVGIWYLARLMEGWASRWRRPALVVVVVLGVWSVWATASLTFLHQRVYGPLVPQASLARLVDLQLSIYEDIPGGAPSRIRHVDALPLPEPDERQSILVVGDCGGVYYSTGRGWHPVELTPDTGTYRLRITFEGGVPGTREPLISAVDDRGGACSGSSTSRAAACASSTSGTANRRPRRTARCRSRSSPASPLTSRCGSIRRSGSSRSSTTGSSLGLDYGSYGPVAASPGIIGEQDVSPGDPRTFSGTIDLRPTPTPVCDRLRRLEDGGDATSGRA